MYQFLRPRAATALFFGLFCFGPNAAAMGGWNPTQNQGNGFAEILLGLQATNPNFVQQLLNGANILALLKTEIANLKNATDGANDVANRLRALEQMKDQLQTLANQAANQLRNQQQQLKAELQQDGNALKAQMEGQLQTTINKAKKTKDELDDALKNVEAEEKIRQEVQKKFKEDERLADAAFQEDKLAKELEHKRSLAKTEADAQARKEIKVMQERATLLKNDPQAAAHEIAMEAAKSGAASGASAKEYTAMFQSPEFLTKVGITTGGVLAAGSIAFFAARYGIPIVMRYIEELMFNPKLTDEVWDPSGASGNKPSAKFADLKDIVLSPENELVKKRLVHGLANAAAMGTYQMNYLFYGEPGTGKTCLVRAIAQELALPESMQRYGMKEPYRVAFMSGGNVFNMLRAGKAVDEINKLFRWAKEKPTILFIDEMDAFCKDPNTMEHNMLAAYNAFIANVGTEDKNLVLIGATNNPNNLPPAIRSRFSQKYHIGLPNAEQREKILTVFANKYIRNVGKIQAEALDEDMIKMLATKLEGFTGRDLSYFMIGLQQESMLTEGAICSRELILDTLDRKLKQKAAEGGYCSYGAVGNVASAPKIAKTI